MGVTCNMHGRDEKCIQGKRPPGWEDNVRMGLREGVDWIHLAGDRDQWRVLANTVINLGVP